MAKENYINNKEFLYEIKIYKEKVYCAREEGKQDPVIPRRIAECFVQIAQRRATHPWFRQYSFVDEMIADAVEDCVRRIMNFDPAKSSNPFAYFSQVVYNAFLRRMKAEQREAKTKVAIERRNNIFGEDSQTQDHDDRDYGQSRIYMEDKYE